MSNRQRAMRVLLVLVAILAMAGCRPRHGAVGDLGEIRDPEAVPPPSSDAILEEACRNFRCCGRAIHPALIYEFIPWVSDSRPVTVAIDLLPAQDAERYYLATVRQRAGWTECNVKSLLPHCWDNEPTINAPEFGYRRVGALADGTQVLRTYYCMGGSGVFMDLVFIRFEVEKMFDLWMKPCTRVVMKVLCVYPLGDRDDGEVTVLSNRVIVGPSKHRAEAVFLKFQ